MTHAYRGLRGPHRHDAMLVAAWLVFFFLVDPPGFRAVMLVAIPLVLAWSIVTLHFPSRVDLDDAGITFAAWGRAHHFAWKDVTRVRVRRFLIRDRVLVRIDPSGPLRGRYWLLEGIDGWDELLRALESRAT